MDQQRAIIIGAGPAGLTAAYELVTRTGIKPIVIEKSDAMGGIARTVNYRGNRIDIGGHRFFSKSDRVIDWWLNIMPAQAGGNPHQAIAYHGMHRAVAARAAAPDPEREDLVMLVRPRKSRIYYLRRFFDYPVTLSRDTIAKLGAWRLLRIALSYFRSVLLPIRDERTLEEFFINRFGRELYKTFFQSYTEKVWGVACSSINSDWGRQRIKGLSIWRTIRHAIGKLIGFNGSGEVRQKNTETSLIEQFLYPNPA
ncbi:MAG: FAD-binding protein [Acidimicrobiia bacterium]|nr:FAD-binding protein [Acidimicrobiia bacterium]